ncbi:MAG: NADH-cytochrome b5 reductase [Monoraphidium minutum]|nr:MAG: NADH-cytochrome b5 reductase [Monoraphidium minutum]
MASTLEDHLSNLLHDNPVGMACTVAIVAVLLFLVMRLASPSKPKVFLDPQQFQPLALGRIDTLTHNTKKFVFKLPDPRMRVGLPTGQHITFFAKDSDGKDVYRPYTPVTDDDTPGAVEFVIKLYDQGKMSQVLAKMKVGDTMLMKGPRGRFTYSRNMKRAFGMIAGGTGVTPCYQVACAILKDPKDTTKISLVFGNLSEDDILLRKELDELEQQHPGRFKAYHVLNKAPDGWEGGVGFITKDVLRSRLPPAAPDVMVLRCGPKPMNDAMKGYLDDLGYSEDAQFEF